MACPVSVAKVVPEGLSKKESLGSMP